MAAILWDGFNKINGFLKVETTQLSFSFVDFNDTNLVLNIPFNKIISVKYHQLFSQENQGIEVISDGPKSNVFVVENAKPLYQKIRTSIKQERGQNDFLRK